MRAHEYAAAFGAKLRKSADDLGMGHIDFAQFFKLRRKTVVDALYGKIPRKVDVEKIAAKLGDDTYIELYRSYWKARRRFRRWNDTKRRLRMHLAHEMFAFLKQPNLLTEDRAQTLIVTASLCKALRKGQKERLRKLIDGYCRRNQQNAA